MPYHSDVIGSKERSAVDGQNLENCGYFHGVPRTHCDYRELFFLGGTRSDYVRSPTRTYPRPPA